MITADAQLRILNLTSCKIYMRPASMASTIDKAIGHEPGIKAINAPALHDLLQDKQAEPVIFNRSWEEIYNNPWLVFHTSGTTGLLQTGIRLPQSVLTYEQAIQSPSHTPIG